MAKIEDILKLIEAGYTKEEISQLTAETPAAETVEKPEEEKPAPAENAPAEEKGVNDDMMTRLADEVAELRKQIQKRNLNDSFIETPKQNRSQDILAQLINPKEEK